MSHFQDWIGSTESYQDQVSATPIAALAATLDRDDPPPQPGDPLPPLWHWLYFLPIHRQSALGPDGHAQRGGFLPPIPLPRRMWAGGRLRFHHPLRVGEPIERVSRIVSVKQKQGRSGPLAFVLVEHQIHNPQGLAIVEEHDIVYRGMSAPDAPQTPPIAAPGDALWERSIQPDDVLLFRYSALTFNGHRIHYDRRYVTVVEGYPGLVVHGPLVATLLLDLLRDELPGAVVSRFDFRAVRPLFDSTAFSLCARPEADAKTIKLWVRDADGWLATEATATLC